MSPSPAFLDADTPNPFAMGLANANPTIPQRLWRGTKTVFVTLMVTALLLSAVYFGKQLLLSQLVNGFDKLDANAKQTRLIQIASFGNAAIQPLVERLVDPDDGVSESAFVLLQKMQNDWITLDDSTSLKPHRQLVDSIQRTYRNRLQASSEDQSLSDKQIARGRELLNQTVLEFADTGSSEINGPAPKVLTLVRSANQLLEQLRQTYSPQRAPTLVKSKDASLENRAGWTDWPPKSTRERFADSDPNAISPSPRNGSSLAAGSLGRHGSADADCQFRA